MSTEPQRELAPVGSKIFRQCAVPGCSSMVGEEVGKQSTTPLICRWCREGRSHIAQKHAASVESSGS